MENSSSGNRHLESQVSQLSSLLRSSQAAHLPGPANQSMLIVPCFGIRIQTPPLILHFAASISARQDMSGGVIHTCHKKLNDKCPSCPLRLGYTRNRACPGVCRRLCYRPLLQRLLPYSRPDSHCWNCSYSPHFCPLPHCDYKAPTSYIVRHLGDHHHVPVPVNFYRCKDTIQVRFRNMDPLLALQLDDSILCLLRNSAMPSGRAISIVCRQPLLRWTILCKKKLYKIAAKHENGTKFLLDNGVMKFCEEDSSDVFLYLPEKFYCDDAELQLEVCIWKV